MAAKINDTTLTAEEVKATQPLTFDILLERLSEPALLSVPKDLRVIDGTFGRFFNGGLHVVHGLSKAGKSYFVLDTLNRSKNVKVIWLDGDQNDRSMIDKFENITHLSPLVADAYLDMWLQAGIEYQNVVFIIDGLKDYKNGEDMDSNSGMDTIIKRFKQFTKLGATVVVIHHSTAYGAERDQIKLKGNAEAIYSNSDITYLYERNWDTGESKLTCERSRVEDMKTGTETIVYPAKEEIIHIRSRRAS